MLLKDIKYCYDDIAVKPAVISHIRHRSACHPFRQMSIGYDDEPTLPIFTAPMSTVVNEKNFKLFEKNNIIPILPRNIDFETRKKYLKEGKWAAVSFNEFEELFVLSKWESNKQTKVLVDIANGHMASLYSLVKDAKARNNGLIIMAGNVANPETVRYAAMNGVDALRLSIGSGKGCLTSSNSALHYGIASLIDESYKVAEQLKKEGIRPPLLIADGGVRNYDDVIKSLALGSDYVMIGSVLAQLTESAAPLCYKNMDGNYVEIDEDYDICENGIVYLKKSKAYITNPTKLFYGMASKKGQIDLSGKKTKTSEGTEKYLPVTTTLEKWSENMADYMQTAMSYTSISRIADFNPNNVDTIILSPKTRESINK